MVFQLIHMEIASRLLEAFPRTENRAEFLEKFIQRTVAEIAAQIEDLCNSFY